MTTPNASEALLVISIGACAFLALLQLWLGLRADGPIRWAGAWATVAVVFSGARLVQINATEPATAILAARVYCACSPFLWWSLCRLVGSVSEAPARRGRRAAVAIFSLACTLAILGTDWFVRAEVTPRVDLSGNRYLAGLGGPALPLVGLQVGVALTWCIRRLRRSLELTARERRMLAAALSIYAAIGASSIASAVGWIPVAGFAEYGPLFMCLAAGHVLSIRQRRQEHALEREIEARSSALRESERRYRAVIDNAPIGFLAVDANGRLEHANPKLLEMLGSTRAQFQSVFDVTEEENAKRSGFAAMLERALRTGDVLSDEFEFDSWWGRRLVTRTSVAPHRDARGAVVGALAIVEDITERRAIERELRRTQRMEAVGQLSAGIAHEINNPMAYVRSNLMVLGEDLAALAKEVRARDPQAAALERIASLDALRVRSLESVQRTVGVVRDLREFSRSSHAERESTDLNALLENAARLVSTRNDGLGEVAIVAGELPPIEGSPGQLRQVFLNLLIHARQAAGPRGRVTVSTQRAAHEALIAIHDDGPPVRPEDSARMFEPFAAARDGGEPSLGLYISQQIVREHGGSLELASSEHGTTFAVRLPIRSE